jgi:hypothetical protein
MNQDGVQRVPLEYTLIVNSFDMALMQPLEFQVLSLELSPRRVREDAFGRSMAEEPQRDARRNEDVER